MISASVSGTSYHRREPISNVTARLPAEAAAAFEGTPGGGGGVDDPAPPLEFAEFAEFAEFVAAAAVGPETLREDGVAAALMPIASDVGVCDVDPFPT
eukprot:24867-Pelagococcus_subviridis.AAC.1